MPGVGEGMIHRKGGWHRPKWVMVRKTPNRITHKGMEYTYRVLYRCAICGKIKYEIEDM